MTKLETNFPPPATTTGPRPLDLLVVLNGSLADKGASVGGGDLVMLKVIRHSNLEPDILLPKSAQPFVTGHGRLFLTLGNLRLTMPGILMLFFARIVQGLWWSVRNRHVYDVALAASPYSVDVFPVWSWKARLKGAVIYHVIPERKAVNLSTRIRFGLAALEQWIMMKVLARACDFIVAGNEFTKRQLEPRLPGKLIFILPAGFDAGAFDRAPSVPKDTDLACFIGRLTSQKGIFDLLKVMAAIRHDHPSFRLVVAGTGPESDFLQAEIKRLDLDNVQLKGFVTNEEKVALLKRAQFFFFPSYEEGWGIALAEALYCGCRCICYELPHYRSIFGDFPEYARLGDPADFTRAFARCRSGEVSAEQSRFVRQYDDPIIVAGLVAHLNSILAGRKPV